MSRGPRRYRDPEGIAAQKFVVWISDDEKDVAASPKFEAASTGLDFTIVANAAAAWDIKDSTGSLLLFDTTTGDLAVRLPDSVDLELGTGADDSIVHNGTNTIWTHATGDLTIDNTLVTGSTILQLGTDTNATDFQVQNDSGTAIINARGDSTLTITATTTHAGAFSVTGAISASAGLTVCSPAPAIADPGDAAAIPVTGNASAPFTTGTGGETGTLAIPTFAGQIISLTMDVDGGGDRVVTAAAGINQAGNTSLTFDAAGEHIALIGVQVAGALVWRVLHNDGVTLA